MKMENGENDSKSEVFHAKRINSQLSRSHGTGNLSTFQTFILNCSDPVFQSNCVKWLQLCCQVGDQPLGNVVGKLRLFGTIIKRSSKFPELAKPIAHSVTSRFCDVFLNKLINNRDAWEAMECLMTSYGGSLTSVKAKLESLMEKNLTAATPIFVHQSRCFALIPSIGGGGVRNTIYRTAWRAQMDRLVVSAHLLLNNLFQDALEWQTFISDASLALKYPHDFNHDDAAIFIQNICTLMQTMLTAHYPAPKNVPAGKLLHLVGRVLSVSGLALGNANVSRIASIRHALQLVHEGFVKVVSGMIICCGRALVPSSTSIVSLLQQALQCSRQSASLRLEVYSAISNWAIVARGASSLETIAKEMIVMLVEDMERQDTKVVLKGKVRMNHADTKIARNDALCGASLKTMSLVINTVGFKLAPGWHKLIHSSVMRQLACRGSEDMSLAAKYRLLLQLCLEPSPYWPPPTQFALALFRTGINNNDAMVASECLTAATVLERIVHPEFSLASFPALLKDPGVIDKTMMGPLDNGSDDLIIEKVTKVASINPSREPITPLSPQRSVVTESPHRTQHATSNDDDDDVSVLYENGPTIKSTENNLELNSLAQSPNPKRRRVEEAQITQEPTNVDNNLPPAVLLGMGPPNIVNVSEPEVAIVENTNENTSSVPATTTAPSGVIYQTSASLICETVTSIVEDGVSGLSAPGEVKVEHKRLRAKAIELDTDIAVDINSPMSLRSGTLVSSQSSSEKRRAREERSPRSHTSSPSSASVDAEFPMDLFDDTLNPELG